MEKIYVLGILLILMVLFRDANNNQTNSNSKLGHNEVSIQNMAFTPTSFIVKANRTFKLTKPIF